MTQQKLIDINMIKEQKDLQENSLGLHITLATIPQVQESEFDKYLCKSFYEDYVNDYINQFSNDENGLSHYYSLKDDAEKKTNVIYNPLKFHMFGNYDMAYISLIDNFKFLHKIIEPTFLMNEIFNSHNYQSYSGITYSKNDILKDIFYSQINTITSKYFVGICNLKLNNGMLIGNGLDYIKAVEKCIESKIKNYRNTNKKDVSFLISQSFSWFEITLIILTDFPADIAEIISEIRLTQTDELDNLDKLINNSLYKSLGFDYNKIKNVNLLSDSQSFIGINSSIITCSEEDIFYKNFIDFLQDENNKIELSKFSTEIEFQVKPGHIPLLIESIKNNNKLKNLFNLDCEYNYLLGKSDYIIKDKDGTLISNVEILRAIYHKEISLFTNIRNIKTRVLFKSPIIKDKFLVDREVISLTKCLKKLAIQNSDINLINKYLKTLKVSRQIRFKILKIFYNFNNGIQDIIMFNLFLDFKIFIENLKKLIIDEYKEWDKILENNRFKPYSLNVHLFEEKLHKWIEVFQEGYNIRLLNGYQFEDIIDFDLDFNSSMQQLLSSLSMFAHEVSNIFYPDKLFGPIIQLNYKDTVANYLSINYASHHITSLEFLYSSLTKEILNHFKSDVNELKQFIDKYEFEINDNKFRIEKKLIVEMIDSDLIKIDYFINDAIRFGITYNFEFKLFEYWSWAYNMQNPALFNKNGMFNELFFRKELFRIMFVAKFYDIDFANFECNIPFLQTYWSRHFEATKEAINQYFDILIEKELLNMLYVSIFKIFTTIFDDMGMDLPVSKENNFQDDHPILKFIENPNFVLPSLLHKDVPKLLDLVLKRSILFESIDINNEFYAGKSIHIQWHMYKNLSLIKKENNNNIYVLNRSWKDGKPLKEFQINNNFKPLYYIDPTGGIFFSNINSMNKYFRLTSSNINYVIDIALKYKKEFINNYINKTT